MATEAKIETISDSESENDEELKVTKQQASQGQWYELVNSNFSAVTDVCLSLDEKLIAACGVVDDPKDQVCVWNLDENGKGQGHMRLTIPGKLYLKRICFSPGGKKLACTNGISVWIVSLGSDKTIRDLGEAGLAEADDDDGEGDDVEIETIFFSLDGNFLAAVDSVGAVHIWNIDTAYRVTEDLQSAATGIRLGLVDAFPVLQDFIFPFFFYFVLTHSPAWNLIDTGNSFVETESSFASVVPGACESFGAC